MASEKNANFATMDTSKGSVTFTNTVNNAKETEPLLRIDRISGGGEGDLKRRLWTSATFLNIGNAFNLAGASLMSPLYSSLYGNGLGVAVQTVTMAGGIIGSIVASLVIGKLGCRKTLIATCCLHTMCFAGNVYPTWNVLILAALISGMSTGTYTVTVRTYLGKLSQIASSKLRIDADRIHSRMFIFNLLLIKLMNIIGNLFSSLVLGSNSESGTTDDNGGRFVDPLTVKCGASYCNEELGSSFGLEYNGTSTGPTTSQFYSLIGYCSVILLAGVVVFVLFVKDLKCLGIENTFEAVIRQRRSIIRTIGSILLQMKEQKFLLLLPFAVSQACGDAFWVADFSKAFVTCASGIQYIGYVAMWSGISGAISCFIFGWFNKNKYRSFPLTVATVAHISVIIVLLYWKPSENSLIQLSALTALWYLGSGIKMALVPALFGVVFSDKMEVAYSNLNVWSFVGGMVFYAISNFLCMKIKLYTMLILLTFSFVGYVIVEVIIYYEKKGLNRMANTCIVIKNNYKTIK